MNGVIYARYSSDHQREESIEGQIRECTEYAQRQGIGYEKTQGLLKIGRMAQLTPRSERDYLIVFAFMKGYSIGDTNDLLIQQGHKILRSDE